MANINEMHRLLRAIKDDATAWVADESHGSGPVGRSVVIPGANVPWDGDCEGMLWVRLVSVLGVAGQRRSVDPTCSIHGWQATLCVGIIRCVPTMNKKGTPPAAEDMTDSAIRIIEDMEALRCFIMGHLPRGLALMNAPTWQAQGAEGGYAGGEWTLTTLLNTCEC